MTNDILDSGKSPAVISVMKQQTTERGRKVTNEVMDIHAGDICVGYNTLENFMVYQSV